MGIHVLYPLGKINIVILCTSIGAIINVFLNVLLIPRYGHNGTAVAYMLAEMTVTVSMFFIGKRYIPIRFLKRQHLNYVLGSVVMGVCLYFISWLGLGNTATLVMMISMGGIVYVVILLFLRDSIGMIPWKILREKFGKWWMIIVITNDGIYIKKKCSILEATFEDNKVFKRLWLWIKL